MAWQSGTLQSKWRGWCNKTRHKTNQIKLCCDVKKYFFVCLRLVLYLQCLRVGGIASRGSFIMSAHQLSRMVKKGAPWPDVDKRMCVYMYIVHYWRTSMGPGFCQNWFWGQQQHLNNMISTFALNKHIKCNFTYNWLFHLIRRFFSFSYHRSLLPDAPAIMALEKKIVADIIIAHDWHSYGGKYSQHASCPNHYAVHKLPIWNRPNWTYASICCPMRDTMLPAQHIIFLWAVRFDYFHSFYDTWHYI